MGNINRVEKPYEISNGRIMKAVDISDIQLPPSRVLCKYTVLIGQEGPFALFDDLSVIDLGDVIDISKDIVNTPTFNGLIKHFEGSSTPVIITLCDSDHPVMISNHWKSLTEKNDEEVHGMRKVICPGFILEYKGKHSRLERVEQGIEVLDIPPNLYTCVLRRELQESDIDAIISGHEVVKVYNNYIVEEGVFNVYIGQYMDTWILTSTPPKDGSFECIRVKAAIISWRPTRNRESLLSQLKPFLLETTSI